MVKVITPLRVFQWAGMQHLLTIQAVILVSQACIHQSAPSPQRNHQLALFPLSSRRRTLQKLELFLLLVNQASAHQSQMHLARYQLHCHQYLRNPARIILMSRPLAQRLRASQVRAQH